MKYRISINGTNLDLSPETVIGINASINDLAELRDRQVSYTNAVSVPMTANNRQILGISGEIGDQSNTPYSTLEATVYVEGLPVIQKGIAVIQPIGPDSAKIAVYSAALGFFESITGKKLHDLDLSSLTHDWTLSNVLDSLDNTSGYTYPLAQHGAQSFFLNNIDVRYLHPAIYAHTVAEQIATEAGYTLGGDFLTNDYWTKTVLPFSKSEYKNGKDFVEDKSFIYRLSSTQNIDETVTVDGADEQLVALSMAPLDTYTASESITFNEINARIDVSGLNITKTDPGAAVSLRFVMLKNGITIVDQQLFTTDGTYSLTASSVSLLAGETLSFQLYYLFAWGGPDPQSARIRMNLSNGAFFSEQPEETIQFGGEVRASAILPNMDQKAFFKALAQMFGLIFDVDNRNKVVYLRQFKEIAQNKASAVDWSNKLAQGSASFQVLETQISTTYGQESWFRYDSDEGVRDEFGDAFLAVSDAQLEPRRDVVNLPWAASQHTEIGASALSVAKIDYYVSDGAGGFEVDGTPSQRFCYLVDVPALFDYTDGTTTTGSADGKALRFTGTGDALDLHFQSLLAAHYTELGKALTKAKKVTALFNLGVLDMYTLDFFKPVWIARYGSYFYINRISDYVAGQLTEVELVRI